MSINPLTGGLCFNTYDAQGNIVPEESKQIDTNEKDINEFYNPRPSTLSYEERLRLVKSVGEEIEVEAELE